ncbi:MAG: hypothetical protein ISQ08_06600 [Planctomycetes bacterium]|nr:hypothetical protein [Planctomycetota bacterium]
MTITEPATLITDWLLALLAIVLARGLTQRDARPGVRVSGPGSGAPEAAARALRAHLLLSAAGAVLGGTEHGFKLHLSPTALDLIWSGTLVLLMLASGALLGFATALWATPGARRALNATGLIGVLAGLALGVPSGAFEAVLLVWVSITLVVLALTVPAWRRGRAGAGAVLASLATSVLGAGIQAAGLAPHPAFNHNDLFHVVQMYALLLLARGAHAALGEARAEDGAARIQG